MNPDRWKRIKALFDEACAMSPPARNAFLEDACGNDADLRKEVASLLAGADSSGFLEKPVYAEAPELFDDADDEAAERLLNGKLGSYEILRRLGSGGMGIVYLGRDARLDRLVAIKIISPRGAYDAILRERFMREARAACKLMHPGIAAVFSLEEGAEGLYAVFEYVPGRTLRKVLSAGALPFQEVLDIARQITEALAAAHAQGIVHRDLKPENIMLTDDGRVKILDFGLARIEAADGAANITAAGLTCAGAFIGTPAYASPEQLSGNPAERATDIFSLGILIYELATGRHPFGGGGALSTAARILQSEAEDISLINNSIPEEFSRIARRCLRKNPEDRYADARELLDDLKQFTEAFTSFRKLCDKPSQERSTEVEALREIPGTTLRKSDAGRDIEKSGASSAFWWWQFHQAVAGFGYYGMLYPLWRVKEWLGGVEGSLLFFPALIAVGVAANLRLHLWFTSSFYKSELNEQMRNVARWIRRADWLFVVMLAVSALRIHTLHAIIATLLMAVAIGGWVAFYLIEPATAKAALNRG